MILHLQHPSQRCEWWRRGKFVHGNVERRFRLDTLAPLLLKLAFLLFMYKGATRLQLAFSINIVNHENYMQCAGSGGSGGRKMFTPNDFSCIWN
jgi:hypothetical protein